MAVLAHRLKILLCITCKRFQLVHNLNLFVIVAKAQSKIASQLLSCAVIT